MCFKVAQRANINLGNFIEKICHQKLLENGPNLFTLLTLN